GETIRIRGHPFTASASREVRRGRRDVALSQIDGVTALLPREWDHRPAAVERETTSPKGSRVRCRLGQGASPSPPLSHGGRGDHEDDETEASLHHRPPCGGDGGAQVARGDATQDG